MSSHPLPTPTTPERFNSSVGAIIFNSQGKLLCGKRIDQPYWQFPQGGMHPDEDPIEAATREVKEEVGLSPSKLTPLTTATTKHHHPMHKDGLHYTGQERQRYVLFHWDGDLSECHLNGTPDEPPAFSEVQWLSWDELIKCAVPSLMFIYARLRNNVPQIIKHYFEKGKVVGIELTATGTNISLPNIPSSRDHIIARFHGNGEYFPKSLHNLNELQGLKIVRSPSSENNNVHHPNGRGARSEGAGGSRPIPIPSNNAVNGLGHGGSPHYSSPSTHHHLRHRQQHHLHHRHHHHPSRVSTSAPPLMLLATSGIIPEIPSTTTALQRNSLLSSELAREHEEEEEEAL